jgi:hypothetical protein
MIDMQNVVNRRWLLKQYPDSTTPASANRLITQITPLAENCQDKSATI